MGGDSSFAVTVSVRTEYFAELLRQHNEGRDGLVTFVIAGNGTEGQRIESFMSSDDDGNTVAVFDASGQVTSPAFIPYGLAKLIVTGTGPSLSSLGSDLATAAGIEPEEIVTRPEWRMPAFDLEGTPVPKFEDVYTLAALSHWDCCKTRPPVITVHDPRGMSEAVRLADRVRSQLPLVVRDYIQIFAMDNRLRSAVNDALSTRTTIVVPHSSVSVLAGSGGHAEPVSTHAVVVAKTPIEKFDGRKIVAGLQRASSELPTFGQFLFSVSNKGPAGKPGGGLSDLDAADLLEKAAEEMQSLRSRLTSTEDEAEALRKQVTSLSRSLRIAEHALENATPNDAAPQEDPVDEPHGEDAAPEPSPTREDYALYARLAEMDLPDTMEGLCAMARSTLRLVGVPASVDGPATKLDDQRETSIWIRRAWLLMCAMEAFATAQAQTGAGTTSFRRYCQHMPQPPMGVRHIAAGESQTVETSKKMREQRTFEVAPGVADAGRIYMGAHARVTASSKPPAPRMHFFDDTMGASRMMHVGYIGAHLDTVGTSRV